MNKNTAIFIIVTAALAITACREGSQSVARSRPAAQYSPSFDPSKIARGAKIFDENCAQCHGPQAQGHPDWGTPGEGSFAAAPPLNGTGNEPKHTKSELLNVIRKGARKNGLEIMPAWQGRLSSQDMEDVMTWFQSLWPPEVYKEWHTVNTANPLREAKP
jgi:mono/diheme cytochrome c family protein